MRILEILFAQRLVRDHSCVQVDTSTLAIMHALAAYMTTSGADAGGLRELSVMVVI